MKKQVKLPSKADISDCVSVIRPSIRDDISALSINQGMPREEQFEAFARTRPPRGLESIIEQNSTITNKLSDTTLGPAIPRFPPP